MQSAETWMENRLCWQSLGAPTPVKTAMTAAITPIITPHSILRPAGCTPFPPRTFRGAQKQLRWVLESAAVTKDMKVASTNIEYTIVSAEAPRKVYIQWILPLKSPAAESDFLHMHVDSRTSEYGNPNHGKTVGTNRFMIIQSLICIPCQLS